MLLLASFVLDISKLDADTIDIQKTEFSLLAMLEKLAHEFDPQATNKNLTIHWPQDSFHVNSDPILLEQVLRNYLANAIRYTDAGGIKVTCELNHDYVQIKVIDTGVGIPVESQSAIFEEFYQLGNPEQDRQKGMGLGLAIVQRAASLLGHEIDVCSQPGQGSTFSIRVDKAKGKGSPVSDAPIFVASPLIKSRPLIIVIDDEESIRDGMKQLLGQWNCEVVACANQQEALAKINSYKREPNGIICDFRLRDNRTGLEAIDAIHIACRSNIPALIVTGDTEKALLIKLKNSGHQFLHKSVPPAKLRAFLRSLPDSSTPSSR